MCRSRIALLYSVLYYLFWAHFLAGANKNPFNFEIDSAAWLLHSTSIIGFLFQYQFYKYESKTKIFLSVSYLASRAPRRE